MKNYLSMNESQKTVEYFGLILTIPDEKGYLSTDDDGTVLFWTKEPTYVDHTLYWDIYAKGDACNYINICKVNLNDIDWKTTLKEIK